MVLPRRYDSGVTLTAMTCPQCGAPYHSGRCESCGVVSVTLAEPVKERLPLPPLGEGPTSSIRCVTIGDYSVTYPRRPGTSSTGPR